MARLSKKVVLVTGAAQGLGAAMALRLAEEEAQLVLCDINKDKLDAKAEEIRQLTQSSIETLQMDVREKADWQQTAQFLEANYGRLNVLVNNAGVELVKQFEDIELDEWRNVQAVNVDGLFLGSQALLGLLKAAAQENQAGASIINLSSIAGIIAFANQLAYNTSKGAVRHMSKSLAIEFAEKRYNIRVNSVHPGFIDTPMLREVFVDWAKKGIMGNTPEEVTAAVAETQPLGHFGRPVDIANGVLFLASDESAFMTGAELVIDGAWTAR